MARPILSYYGPDTPKPQAPRMTKGGVFQARDVMDYKPPQGPIGINRAAVGLGGANLGPCGSQGEYNVRGDGGSGSPGLHGENRGMGSNRKG